MFSEGEVEMISMKEIAKEAGVSQATVSRVINGNNRVNPDIRQRVLNVIRKNDYQPNIIAKSLVSNTSKLIGVIVTDIANPFFVDIIKAVEEETSRLGYSIILCNSDMDPTKEKKYINMLKSYNVDGILLAPCDDDAEYLENLKNHNLPIVLITNDYKGYTCVSISHSLAGKEVANHLVNLGYGRFVFVGPGGDDKEIGFKNGLVQRDIDIDRKYFSVKNKPYDALKANLSALLKDQPNTEGTGIFVFNDINALNVLHILKELAVKVPEDVAIVGFDNTYISREISPTLSTVAQPIDQIGIRSVELLLEKIGTRNTAPERHIQLDSRLVVRESSLKMTRSQC
jgi:LacI family transcriptional regulator